MRDMQLEASKSRRAADTVAEASCRSHAAETKYSTTSQSGDPKTHGIRSWGFLRFLVRCVLVPATLYLPLKVALFDEPRSYSHNAVGLAAADRTQRPVDAAGAEYEDAYPRDACESGSLSWPVSFWPEI
jgi:hypothetical protein